MLVILSEAKNLVLGGIIIISVNKNRYHNCQDKQRKYWIPAFAGMTTMLNRL